MSQNILFFSKNCKTCNTFITMCHQNKILKHFQMIDIDDKIQILAQKGLNVVPTILVKGINTPIEGKNVFNWLNSVLSINNSKNDFQVPDTNIKKRNSLNSNNQNINKNIDEKTNEKINEKINEPSVKKIPFGYLKEEMTGFSDSFAYVVSDEPLPKSFLPYNKDLEIYTAPEGKKLDQQTQNLLINKLQSMREKDKNIFVDNINKSHKELLNNKQ